MIHLYCTLADTLIRRSGSEGNFFRSFRAQEISPGHRQILGPPLDMFVLFSLFLPTQMNLNSPNAHLNLAIITDAEFHIESPVCSFLYFILKICQFLLKIRQFLFVLYTPYG